MVLSDRLIADGVVVCRSGLITYVGKAKSKIPKGLPLVDAAGGFICPGFVDIHVHGGGGSDFMDGTIDAVRTACRSHARHGTTTLFPTTSTGSEAELQAMLHACVSSRDQWSIDAGSKIGGVHLYGPYFAPDKVGCHNQSECRSPQAAEYRDYFKTGIIKVATCAAELEGAAAFYRYAHKRGCLVTCGHSNSSWTEMAMAYQFGMRHVDHFWCAMSSVPSVRSRLGFPMQGSMMEFVLAHPEMSTEVIADGMHLSPELLRFAWQMKTAQRLCLVTDCNRALDMPPGRYRFGPMTDGSWFESDGEVGWACNDSGEISSSASLASAVKGMDHMLRTMHLSAGVPLQDAVRMASLTPAERTGIDDRVGSLEVGKSADVVCLSRRLQVTAVHLAGTRFSTN